MAIAYPVALNASQPTSCAVGITTVDFDGQGNPFQSEFSGTGLPIQNFSPSTGYPPAVYLATGSSTGSAAQMNWEFRSEPMAPVARTWESCFLTHHWAAAWDSSMERATRATSVWRQAGSILNFQMASPIRISSWRTCRQTAAGTEAIPPTSMMWTQQYFLHNSPHPNECHRCHRQCVWTHSPRAPGSFFGCWRRAGAFARAGAADEGRCHRTYPTGYSARLASDACRLDFSRNRTKSGDTECVGIPADI